MQALPTHGKRQHTYEHVAEHSVADTLPAPQAEHGPPAEEAVPAGQQLHAVLSAFDVCPAAHSLHEALVAAAYVPSEHRYIHKQISGTEKILDTRLQRRVGEKALQR